MPVTIRNRWTGETIATVEDTDDLREAVIRLVRQGVSLRDANLRAADLRAADLRDADLRDANLRDANLSAADLSDANLRAADLRAADLSDANLRAADLRAADLRDANLRDANLRDADLQPIKDDLFAVLSYAPTEVPALIAALEQGRVNGSTYSDGECGCLVGTLAIASGKDPAGGDCDHIRDLRGIGSRPIERFFLSIHRGSTPENSQHAKLAHEWASEWLASMKAAFAGEVVHQ